MAVALEKYKQKRNFEKTPEPEGADAHAGDGLRFVVQHHMARRDHYDVRLEWDGALLSWAVPKGPSYNTRDKRLAVQVEAHPLEYRNFEGTIPKGEYGGGTVMLWDEGTWEPQGDVTAGLDAGALKFILRGKRLRGKWALIRLKEKAGESKDNWLLLKEKDEFVQYADGISQWITSIRTGRTMEEIETGDDDKIARNPFDNASVQLATLVKTVPEGGNWLYEVKYDGYRILAYVEGGSVRLITRNGSDYTKRFRDVADALTTWSDGRAMVLDGEMVITDDTGKTDFQALQNYMKNPRGGLTYIIFDLLALDGKDLRTQPLTQRKMTLETLLNTAPSTLHYSQHVPGRGKESFSAACTSNLEGIIGKKADSAYSGTRNGDWIKLKCDKRQEFVIGGYTLSDKKTSGVSSLLLGVFEGSALIYAGRAGTGFTARLEKELAARFQEIKRETFPFKTVPPTKAGEKIIWLEPILVAEIKFAEWTDENLLRQASFKGLRADKAPQDIKRETEADNPMLYDAPETVQTPGVTGEKSVKGKGKSMLIDGVKITSPDKVIFEDPDITKLEVIRYYDAIADRMLPYVEKRILSIVRCPKGVTQTCFYKKHPGPDSKAVVTMPVTNSSGETEDYFYIDNATGLIYEAQMGTLEFHTWGSRVDSLEHPDIMVFDLDPDEGMALDTVRQGVLDIKSLLDELSLVSYLKTSGGKGYHVVVPFTPTVGWDAFHDFARSIAEVAEKKWPDRYTSNVRKANRKNRIFIDWIRNGRGATSIAPYSIRARKGARVSMPLTWDALAAVAPDEITMARALEMIKSEDPWQGFFQTQQRLK